MSVGDLNDRGPDTRSVLDYFMANKNCFSVQSNHGHMMVDAFKGIEKFGTIQTIGFIPAQQDNQS